MLNNTTASLKQAILTYSRILTPQKINTNETNMKTINLNGSNFLNLQENLMGMEERLFIYDIKLMWYLKF